MDDTAATIQLHLSSLLSVPRFYDLRTIKITLRFPLAHGRNLINSPTRGGRPGRTKTCFYLLFNSIICIAQAAE